MAWLGLGLLAMVALGIVVTGLPAFLVLLTAASAGAALAVLSGTVPLALLSALPGRVINLLETDLLQALPLYVLMGVLLDRLPIADALFRTGLRILPRGAAAPVVCGLGLGALLGPMNGSVGASVLSLARAIDPRLRASGVSVPARTATIAVASTLGVVIPPSLVLILLGDAMLSAHTIAVTATGRGERVINTQDVFHGALVPAGLFLAAALIVAWLTTRRVAEDSAPASTRSEAETVTSRQALLAGVSILALLLLLGGVATGYFYAVEGAATGAFVLLVAGAITGRLPAPALGAALSEVMAITGALFALLMAATTLTLVLRLLGTDHLVGDWVVGLPGNDDTVVVIVLAIIALSAFVLDAFEIIFVVVPIVVPPLLIRVADARWVAVLVLLTLQMSFLLPPFGYALMMVRSTLKATVPLGALVRALAPFLLAQWAVLAVVLAVPQLVHVGENPADRVRAPAVPLSPQDLDRRLREMVPPPEASDPALRP